MTHDGRHWFTDYERVTTEYVADEISHAEAVRRMEWLGFRTDEAHRELAHVKELSLRRSAA